MKVILLQDVAKIGRRFSITDVPDGYALNKLIPQKLAQPATPENVKRINAQASKTEGEHAKTQEIFEAALAGLAEKTVAVTVDANDEGKMFQALKVDAIIEAVKNEAGVTVHANQIVLKDPIKTVGEHVVNLVSGDTHGTVTINVVSK